jgi:hypothetical protein
VLAINAAMFAVEIGAGLAAGSASLQADALGSAYPIYEAGEILMSSRSERYLANAEKCQQYADAVDTSGTKRLYEELARQWLHLAAQAEKTDGIESSPPLARQPVGARASPMPSRETQPTPPKTSAIDSSRDVFEKVEREIERLAGLSGSGKS